MMRKIILLFVMITLALGVFAQSKGKNGHDFTSLWILR